MTIPQTENELPEVVTDLIETLMDYVNRMYMHRGDIGEQQATAFYDELSGIRNKLRLLSPQSQQTREEKMDQEIARLISECSDQNKKLGGSEILMGSGRELHLKLEKLFSQARQQWVKEVLNDFANFVNDRMLIKDRVIAKHGDTKHLGSMSILNILDLYKRSKALTEPKGEK